MSKEKKCKDVTEGSILCRLLLYVFIPAMCVVIMGNIGVTGLIALGKRGGGKLTMGILHFNLRRSYFRKKEDVVLSSFVFPLSSQFFAAK